MEQYTVKRPQEVLIVKAEIDGELDEIAIFKSFSSFLTMGSEYWPKTPEGRILCLVLALYAFAVFGYVTATIATFFIGRDAEDDDAELAGAKSIAALQTEIAALRAEIQQLLHQNSKP